MGRSQLLDATLGIIIGKKWVSMKMFEMRKKELMIIAHWNNSLAVSLIDLFWLNMKSFSWTFCPFCSSTSFQAIFFTPLAMTHFSKTPNKKPTKNADPWRSFCCSMVTKPISTELQDFLGDLRSSLIRVFLPMSFSRALRDLDGS